jgi:recombination protein RecA
MMPIDAKYIRSIIEDTEGVASGEEARVEHWLDSGNYALNRVISGDYKKGLPFGRVLEVFGDPSTGKSLLIYHWIANIQKMGGVAILDDTEDAYTEEFGKMIGIDNSSLILLSSLTVEDHFEKVFLGWKDSKGKDKPGLVDLIWEKDTKCPILIALDSLALLSTRHEQEVRLEKADMSKAKIIRAALRNSSGWMRQGNLMHVISNHVTSKIGVMFGNPKTTPGGSGVPFSASVRLELSYTGRIKDEDNPDKIIGVHSVAKGSKNKIAAPFQKCELDVLFGSGVDQFSGLMDNMMTNGLLKEGEKKGHITIGGEDIRKSEFTDYIKKNPSKLDFQKSAPVTIPKIANVITQDSEKSA